MGNYLWLNPLTMEADDNNQPERKSLDDRARMTELERIRHSCAQVMATAILLGRTEPRTSERKPKSFP